VHEMGICDGIVTAALETAAKERAVCINSIDVTIGVLTEIQEEALQFAFTVITKDTIADRSALNVTMLKARSVCGECAAEFEHGRFDAKCPECGSFVCSLLQGRELRIDSIDID